MLLLYFIIWVILNGKLTLEIALFGVAISAAVFAFSCFFVGHSVKKELKIYKNCLLGLAFAFMLLVAIVKANFSAIAVILTKKEPKSKIVTFDVPLKSKFTRAAFANSITITPGTITVNLTEDSYTVHCLDESFAEGVDSGILLKILMKMEGAK